jgi:hypothetical protein
MIGRHRNHHRHPRDVAMSWGVGLERLAKQRPWRPLGEPPESDWLPWWLEVALGASLVVAVIVLIRSRGNDHLGECSFQTGYEPEVGLTGAAPALLVLDFFTPPT